MPAREARLKDVAHAAGASVGTVSNVFNQPEIVALPARERAHTAVNVVPNRAAATLQ